jgi:ATP-binding cassette subfamily B protein
MSMALQFKSFHKMTLIDFIWKFVCKQRWLFVFTAFLSLVWAFETLFWPFFIGRIVDILNSHDADRMTAWPMLQGLLLWGAFLWLAMETVFRIRDYLQAHAYPKLEEDIRMAMFDHVQRHSPKYFQSYSFSRLGEALLPARIPPSIVSSIPVMYFASSEAKNNAA